MLTSTPLRFLVSTVAGAAAYYFLLTPVYNLAYPLALPPAGWIALFSSRWAAHASWFILRDASCALIAALPVALVLVRWGGDRRKALGLTLGVLVGLMVLVEGLYEYGVARNRAAWLLVVGCQLLALSTAVMLLLTLLPPANNSLQRR